ncbi:MAG: bifunctional folylpolyglutamate synthase/dihydrofolate synthase [Alphaproteobacteria bacterium]|nr:bifunctional folylpolyglutamate synthase/dihydrofolate synthase [Alphaproteobacteria bacterium]
MPPGPRPPNSDAVLARLAGLHPRRIDLSLGRVRRLLKALGHPERDLAPVIHIAGTNGKGSVVAYLKAMAEAANLKPNVYTSPHLVHFTERIRPAGRRIGDAALARLLEECEAANGDNPITFFEITTAAAFLAFARAKADLTVLETGLGGRLDATNVIARPRVTVITPVSLDHQQFLGTRLAQIAGEKAGILKRRVPAVIGPQHAIAARVIADRAGELDAPLIRWGREFSVRPDADGLGYRDADGILDLPHPSLPGGHQAANAATAVAALKAFGNPRITPAAMAKGLAQATWPARLQRLSGGPLTRDLIARGFAVWLDGGHNPSAGRALARALAGGLDDAFGDTGPLYLVVGMVAAKDPIGFLTPIARLLPPPRGLWAVAVPGEHTSFLPEVLAADGRRLGIPARPAASLETALAEIARQPPGRVLITGSLYLAGAVLKADRVRIA